MKCQVPLTGIMICCLLSFMISCPEESDDLNFHTFYNADSNCGSSSFIYDYYGKDTRVIEESRQLYVVADDCIVDNTRISGMDLYVDEQLVAKIRCGYTTDGNCLYFWTNPTDGRHMVITGNCSAGYSFSFVTEQYSPC